ncbi:epoxyqueuosine reductase, partial [Chloroflexota bacterium]
MITTNSLRGDILKYVKEQEVDIIGFAAADTWDKLDEVPYDFRPKSIWGETRTVIVMGIAMLLPVLETTPSIIH